MAAHNEAPCRVSAELRRKQYEDNQAALERIAFDEADEEHIKQLFHPGSRLAMPLYKLLGIARQIDWTAGSFGVDTVKALAELRVRIDILREACADEYKDL